MGNKLTQEMKDQLDDLVSMTIVPAISEDVVFTEDYTDDGNGDIEYKEVVDECVKYIIQCLEVRKQTG